MSSFSGLTSAFKFFILNLLLASLIVKLKPRDVTTVHPEHSISSSSMNFQVFPAPQSLQLVTIASFVGIFAVLWSPTGICFNFGLSSPNILQHRWSPSLNTLSVPLHPVFFRVFQFLFYPTLDVLPFLNHLKLIKFTPRPPVPPSPRPPVPPSLQVNYSLFPPMHFSFPLSVPCSFVWRLKHPFGLQLPLKKTISHTESML